MTADLESITRDFFEAWGNGWSTFVASFDHFADDCVWVQGSAVTRTRGDAVGLMINAHETAGVERCDVTITNLWVVENTVITERIDTMYRVDGSLVATAPVTGIMDFNREGQIQSWREYFDSASLGSLSG
jgi:limonene-1,2-epoxide hydrolase